MPLNLIGAVVGKVFSGAIPIPPMIQLLFNAAKALFPEAKNFFQAVSMLFDPNRNDDNPEKQRVRADLLQQAGSRENIDRMAKEADSNPKL